MAGWLGQKDEGSPARDDSIETRKTRMNRECEMPGSDPGLLTLGRPQLGRGLACSDRAVAGGLGGSDLSQILQQARDRHGSDPIRQSKGPVPRMDDIEPAQMEILQSVPLP